MRIRGIHRQFHGTRRIKDGHYKEIDPGFTEIGRRAHFDKRDLRKVGIEVVPTHGTVCQAEPASLISDQTRAVMPKLCWTTDSLHKSEEVICLASAEPIEACADRLQEAFARFGITPETATRCQLEKVRNWLRQSQMRELVSQ